MTTLDKLSAIRKQMSEKNIAAYIIPSSDPHISEYLPEYYRCLYWASGFTGSAGTLVITQNFAGLWTDSRYFVQANQQLEGSGYELVKLKVQHAPEYIEWIAEQCPKGATIAFDGNLASLAVAQNIQNTLSPRGFVIEGHCDLLSPIWKNRPELPKNKAYLLDVATTGQSTSSKIAQVRQQMEKNFCEAHLISSLDDLAWLLNIRGTDVQCNPVVLGFVLLTKDRVNLYIDPSKLSTEDSAKLKSEGVDVVAYEKVYSDIQNLSGISKILIDPRRTCFAIFDSIPNNITIVQALNPSNLLKAVKNQTELQHTREAMAKDGVAMTKFFKWLEETIGKETLTEISIADKLQKFREEQANFKDISFDTIAGYKDHGALPHYKAEPEFQHTLEPKGLLLVDSGGQYLDGTTDITRVISLGETTQLEKEDYTIVLKGMIEGSMAVFTKGTKGYQIDAITRRPIWTTQRNYGHGTGHGVGFFLNVHEGPHVFNPTPTDIAIEPGMITSIEPGLYREGKHGIRIENLVAAKELDSNEFGDFMDFETLTVCYIDTHLIEKNLLHQEHIDWLNQYNQWVYDVLAPRLDKETNEWLAQKTKAI